MGVSLLKWGRPILGLVLGLVALGSNAFAGHEYEGDAYCIDCHQAAGPGKSVADDYYQHGHRWIEVATNGLRPEETPDHNFGFASVLGEEGNAILGHPEPATVFVANYLPDPNDSNKKKWALVGQDGIPFTGADGKFITASASLTEAQKALARKLDWPDVRALLGNFKEGAGEFVTSTGQLVSEGGTWNQGGTYLTASVYTKRCFHCHNPVGYSATPTADDPRTMYGIPFGDWKSTLKSGSTVLATFAIGAPALDGPASDPLSNRINGVQCEHCHGPGGTFQIPTDATTPKRVELCRDCHSTTDPTDPTVDVNVFPNVDINGKATWDTNKRIPFAPTSDGESGVFTNHHSQGDEFRRSAHKAVRMKLYDKFGNPVTTDGAPLKKDKSNQKYIEQGCVMCHDPHKSVWHMKGGVKYVGAREDYATVEKYEEAVGTMCTACHQQDHPDLDPAQPAKKVRLRGVMGEIGVPCIGCHMPEKSDGSASGGVANALTGGRFTHFFKINPTALAATDNVVTELTTPWATTTAKYWKSTELNGDSFLTLDLVCSGCHDGSGAAKMTLEQMAEYAPSVHRMSDLVDLSVNGQDGLQKVKKADTVKVDISIEAGDKAGTAAEIWIISQGPKGWSSWDLKKNAWKAGLRASSKAYTLPKAYTQNVWNKTLSPGNYTYWVCVYPAGSADEYVVNVPVYVSKK